MDKYIDLLPHLRDCPDCGNDNIKWCAISVRPYCECGRWGKVNYGTVKDAIDSWNEKTEHEKHLELKAKYSAVCAELEEAQKEIEKLKAEKLKLNEHVEILAIHLSEVKVIADKGETTNTLSEVVEHCLGKIKVWRTRWDKRERGES